MTVADQPKVLDRKVKQNKVHYDLDRKAAKISPYVSNNLDKYEYLTGEDLDYKPDTVEKAKFEYSPLGKIFNKLLTKEDKKEGILKEIKKYWRQEWTAVESNWRSRKETIRCYQRHWDKVKITKYNQFFSWITSGDKKIVRWAKKRKNIIVFKKLMEQFLTLILLKTL